MHHLDPARIRYFLTVTASLGDVTADVVEIPANTRRHRPDLLAVTVVAILPPVPAVTVFTFL